MSYLAQAIEWKYGNSSKARCNLETDTIEEWDHPTDPQPDVATLLAEYEPVRLLLVQDAQDLDDIRADADVIAMNSRRPGEIDSHFGGQVNVPSLAEQVAILAKQIKLLS